jgi:hypothetical protein
MLESLSWIETAEASDAGAFSNLISIPRIGGHSDRPRMLLLSIADRVMEIR